MVKHLVSTKSYDSWPPRVKDSDFDPLPKLLSRSLKARKNHINAKTHLMICKGNDGTEFFDGDLLIFTFEYSMNSVVGVTRSGASSPNVTVFKFKSVAISTDKVTLVGYYFVSDELEPCH
ncbi:hypothetical protein CsSME_00016548 [Camellia sinensis var. sinensis]